MWSIWNVANVGESPMCPLEDFLIFNQAKCSQYTVSNIKNIYTQSQSTCK